MKTIQLINSRSGWLARTNDPAIIEAFGTDTLPTAFTEEASPMFVLARIQELNPDAIVTFKTN